MVEKAMTFLFICFMFVTLLSILPQARFIQRIKTALLTNPWCLKKNKLDLMRLLTHLNLGGHCCTLQKLYMMVSKIGLTLYNIVSLLPLWCVCSSRMDLSSRLVVWQQLAESCGLATVQQGAQQVWRLLLLCLICRLCFRLGELCRRHVSM